MATLGEIIFGKNNSDSIIELFIKKDITAEEAKEVVKAIEHPEMLRVLKSLELQVQAGSKILDYDLEKNPEHLKYYSVSSPKDPWNNLLFSTWSYHNNLILDFYKLLEKVFEGYKHPKEGYGLCCIVLEKSQ